MSKTLYMLHIPKCSGSSISEFLRALVGTGVPFYPDRSGVFNAFSDYGYVHGHYGIAPLVESAQIETAVLVRDPIDRSISNFLWLMMRGKLQSFDKYASSVSLLEKLRYFLFDDTNLAAQHNLQTKFLCNSISDLHINTVFSPNPTNQAWVDNSATLWGGVGDYSINDWHLDGAMVSLDMAKATIDKAVILGTVETHDAFVQKMLDWFMVNYSIDISAQYGEAVASRANGQNDPLINYSAYFDYSDNTVYTTASLKAMLTPAEIQQIEDNNQIDRQIYEYVKAKLA